MSQNKGNGGKQGVKPVFYIKGKKVTEKEFLKFFSEKTKDEERVETLVKEGS